MFSECFNKILFWLSWKSGRICSKFFRLKLIQMQGTELQEINYSCLYVLDWIIKDFLKKVLGPWEFPLLA